MPSVYDLKPKFQSLLRPITNSLARNKITANQITILACILSIVSGALIYFYKNEPKILLILPIFLFARMALNAIDGMLAREHSMTSDLGAILNELGDVISDTALYLPLAYHVGFSPQVIIGIVILSVISEMTGVLGVQISNTRNYNGPMGKSDRALVFGTLGLILGLGVTPGKWLLIVCAVVFALLIFTIINRAKSALKNAR